MRVGEWIYIIVEIKKAIFGGINLIRSDIFFIKDDQ